MKYRDIEHHYSKIENINTYQQQIDVINNTKQDKLFLQSEYTAENPKPVLKTVQGQEVLGEGNITVKRLNSGVLLHELIATLTIGGITEGTVYPAGTPIDDILEELFSEGPTNA